MDAQPNEPWVAYRQRSSRPCLRLFCFPYAGGAASIYRSWVHELPVGVELCPVQLPGRETRHREQPFTRMAALVEAASRALLPLFDVPFCLFGHSLGGLVCFELARQLRRQHGISPQHLIVSGQGAPQLHQRSALRYDLPEDEFLAGLTRLSGTPKEALESRELMELLLPMIRADCEVYDTYEYLNEPALDCSISAYGGLDDPEWSRDEVEAWSGQTASRFALHMFPGDHFFLNTSRQGLLRALSAELREIAFAL
jgi:surfactin synthase thioesterase subunit